MKDICFKKYAKGMGFQDKVGLLFADRNRRYDTQGKEGILSPEEEEAIFKDLQERHQVDEYNRLNAIFNLVGLAVIDVHVATLSLELAVSRFNVMVMSVHSRSSAHSMFNMALSGLVGKGDKGSIKLLEEMAATMKKMDHGGFYDILQVQGDAPPDTEMEPNITIQKLFLNVVKANHRLRENVYGVEYLLAKTSMDLLGVRGKELMDGAKQETDELDGLMGMFSILKVYRMFLEKKLMRSKGFAVPVFLEALADHVKVFQLLESAKPALEQELERLLRKNL